MRTYWDTSAAINAAISPEVFRRLDSGEHVARLHLLAEFFATMTGRGVEITDEAGHTDRGEVQRAYYAQYPALPGFGGKCCMALKRLHADMPFVDTALDKSCKPFSLALFVGARIDKGEDCGLKCRRKFIP